MGESEGQIGVVSETNTRDPIDIDSSQFTEPTRRRGGEYFDASDLVGPRVVAFLKLARQERIDKSERGFFQDAGELRKFETEGEDGANIGVLLYKDGDKPVYKVKLSLKENRSEGYTPEVFLTKEVLVKFKEFLKEPPEKVAE